MPNPTLSRDEMVRIIEGGGSVMIGQTVVARVQDLPSPAVLALGDPAAEAATARDLDAQIADLQRQRALLGGADAPAPIGVTAEPRELRFPQAQLAPEADAPAPEPEKAKK